MSKKKYVKTAIRTHQPNGGGYGIELSCTCGDTYSAAHQIEAVLAAWDASGEATLSERYWAS